MANTEIELNPVDFITIGTVGPKGRRLFHLQAGSGSKLVTLSIEKEQARALAETVEELLEDLGSRRADRATPEDVDWNKLNMDLREPIDAEFRVAHMGLGYDAEHDLIVLVAQEIVVVEEDQDPDTAEASVARFWASREQMRALSRHAREVVKAGRVDPQSNGRLLYYWT
jgi:uncharacterized repeat protein (TIGR03847 family)